MSPWQQAGTGAPLRRVVETRRRRIATGSQVEEWLQQGFRAGNQTAQMGSPGQLSALSLCMFSV